MFETKLLAEEMNYVAPDCSEIRLLLGVAGGGICHCSLPVDKISSPVYHSSVEEIWYFLSGQGQVWRKQGDQEQVDEVHPGICITIPTATQFQFRNTGQMPLEFIIATMPPWPGADEAVKLEKGKWPVPTENRGLKL